MARWGTSLENLGLLRTIRLIGIVAAVFGVVVTGLDIAFLPAPDAILLGLFATALGAAAAIYASLQIRAGRTDAQVLSAWLARDEAEVEAQLGRPVHHSRLESILTIVAGVLFAGCVVWIVVFFVQEWYR